MVAPRRGPRAAPVHACDPGSGAGTGGGPVSSFKRVLAHWSKRRGCGGRRPRQGAAADPLIRRLRSLFHKPFHPVPVFPRARLRLRDRFGPCRARSVSMRPPPSSRTGLSPASGLLLGLCAAIPAALAGCAGLLPTADRHGLEALEGDSVLVGAWLGSWPPQGDDPT